SYFRPGRWFVFVVLGAGEIGRRLLRFLLVPAEAADDCPDSGSLRLPSLSLLFTGSTSANSVSRRSASSEVIPGDDGRHRPSEKLRSVDLEIGWLCWLGVGSTVFSSSLA